MDTRERVASAPGSSGDDWEAGDRVHHFGSRTPHGFADDC